MTRKELEEVKGCLEHVSDNPVVQFDAGNFTNIINSHLECIAKLEKLEKKILKTKSTLYMCINGICTPQKQEWIKQALAELEAE